MIFTFWGGPRDGSTEDVPTPAGVLLTAGRRLVATCTDDSDTPRQVYRITGEMHASDLGPALVVVYAGTDPKPTGDAAHD